MLHRALFGSIERFFGVLLEHYAGALPTWLSPVQVRVLPVASAHEEYADVVAGRLRGAGTRTDIGPRQRRPRQADPGRQAGEAAVRARRRRRRSRRTDRRRQPPRRRGRARRAGRRVHRPTRRRARRRRIRRRGRPERDATVLERLWNGWRASYVQSGGLRVPEGAGDEAGADDTGNWQTGQRVQPDPRLGPLRRRDVHRPPGHARLRHLQPLPVLGRAPARAARTARSASSRPLAPTRPPSCGPRSRDAVTTLKAVYQPEGINVGINLGKPAGGSVSEHLHVHVVPRWTGDANFMTATANTRTLPEALDVTAARIRAAWS